MEGVGHVSNPQGNGVRKESERKRMARNADDQGQISHPLRKFSMRWVARGDSEKGMKRPRTLGTDDRLTGRVITYLLSAESFGGWRCWFVPGHVANLT